MQMNQSLIKATLMSVLRQARPKSVASLPASVTDNTTQARALLGDLLIASNQNWKEETLAVIDQVWKAEAESEPTVATKDLPVTARVGSTAVSVYQGDITQLGVDAIVNAANEQGLGCFVPQHKCIDNVIHRRAGPRLRMECEQAMQARGGRPLVAGTEPIVTSAYHLPSRHVIHVTGPQITNGLPVSVTDKRNLAKAYELSLDAASANGDKSIAFPCISTGLFGFPADDAADIALRTVKQWIEQNPGRLDIVVFDVFTNTDAFLYAERVDKYFPDYSTVDSETGMNSNANAHSVPISIAKCWIEEADAVLICAGAGMSVKEGEMVYTNARDFEKHYPWFPKWGYRTSYEVMGLGGDSRVPTTAKWALYAKHMDNMRWAFTPNEGYDSLLRMVKDKDHFVLTSNVDACFERSGFDPARIYTPQGEWTYLQCMKPCQPDSVFDSRLFIDAILPNISDDGFIPEEFVPKCPRCGGEMFGNVRGGSWFLHHKYKRQNEVLRQWMDSKVDGSKKVVVIEVGAGFNTPTVTRFPVEAFLRELGSRGSLIRINPTEAEVPGDLKSISIPEGWQVLSDIEGCNITGKSTVEQLANECSARLNQKKSDLLIPNQTTLAYAHYFGHFDWRRFLLQLKED